MGSVRRGGLFKHLIAQRSGGLAPFLFAGVVEVVMDGPDADRAGVDVDDLLKVILGLAIVRLLLEILGTVLDLTFALIEALPTLIVVAIVVLIALRLTDRI
jgi:hypothetical protein